MKYIIALNGKKYEVEVEKGQATAVYAGQAEPMSPQVQAAPAAAPQPAAAPAAAPAPAAEQGLGDPVKAPMPGTILDVRVSVGQAVKEGDIMFVLEAMKMENDILAECDGTVTGIYVNRGDTVADGVKILTIE